MRKIYSTLLVLIIASCDSNEALTHKGQSTNNPTQTYIINGDIEYISEITDGSKPTSPKLVYQISDKINNISDKITSETSEQSTFLNFQYGLYDPTKSGCTITKYTESGKTYESDAGVYGPIPYPQTNGYMVRGFSVPHQNPYYGALVLISSNRENKRNIRTGVWHENIKRGSAISIEYDFKKNVTYEIIIKAKFHDNRYSLDKVFSSGYPILYAQLKDNGIITVPNVRGQNQDPCEREGINDLNIYADDYINYTRSYSPDNHVEEQKSIVFKFSPTNEKKALLISLHPTIGIEGYELSMPTNSYTMVLPSITITEKPFDASLNVELPIKPDFGGPGRR